MVKGQERKAYPFAELKKHEGVVTSLPQLDDRGSVFFRRQYLDFQ